MKLTETVRMKGAGFMICVTALLLCTNLSAQNGNGRPAVSGRIVNGADGNVVGYATILLVTKPDTTKVFGATTDAAGHFELKVPRGNYLLRASFLGFQTKEQEVSVTESIDLGDIRLDPSAVDIDAVVVTGELIVREADRFVVNVGNSPAAIGQTANDMLRISPGVWVDEKNGISINGKSNTKVMINERYVQETGEDLVNYLNTIKAEDIIRIEVIPMAGVEYDADAQGGIVKITLKKQREDGIEGSVSMRYGRSIFEKSRFDGAEPGMTQYIQPSVTLNYMVKKLRLYTTISENNQNNFNSMEIWTNPLNNEKRDQAVGQNRLLDQGSNKSDWPSLRIGAIYDINDMHSVGVEGNLHGFFPTRNTGIQTAWDTPTGETEPGTKAESAYGKWWKYKNMNFSANYIAKLDTVGSTFKLLADFYTRDGRDNGHFHTDYYDLDTFRNWNDNPYGNSYYEYEYTTNSNLYSLTGDFDVKAGKTSRVKTGMKYSYRNASGENFYKMADANYPGGWYYPSNRNNATGYDEHIAALYGNYSTAIWKILNVSVGLRGEYTNIQPWLQAAGNTNNDLLVAKQSYFSLFPNANLSTTLDKKGNHMLILAYNRKINRPWFSNLLPVEEPIASNIIFRGNPHLKPIFSNDLSLSYVIAKKYNLTLGTQFMTDPMSQVVTNDAATGMQYLDIVNLESVTMPYVNLNIPLQATKWWKINANLLGNYIQSWIDDKTKVSLASFRGTLKNDFTLVKNLYYDVEAQYSSPMQFGNMRVGSNYRINTGLRYTFLKGKMTANVYVNDLFNTSLNKMTMVGGEGRIPVTFNQRWSDRRLGLSFRYNFRSGKEFKVKNVESGESDGGGGKSGGLGL